MISGFIGVSKKIFWQKPSIAPLNLTSYSNADSISRHLFVLHQNVLFVVPARHAGRIVQHSDGELGF